jgi:hypothetical protein
MGGTSSRAWSAVKARRAKVQSETRLLGKMRLRETSNFCYLKLKLQVTKVTAIYIIQYATIKMLVL